MYKLKVPLKTRFGILKNKKYRGRQSFVIRSVLVVHEELQNEVERRYLKFFEMPLK